MIEIPEAAVIARQVTETIVGKQIACAVANASPHKFAWYTGDPAAYDAILRGKVIGAGSAMGGSIEFEAGDRVLSISAPIRYYLRGEKRPVKHQLLLEFEDGTAISSSAQMWGGFFCFPIGGEAGFPDSDLARKKPSPLTGAFDRAYFASLLATAAPALSTKAFLATEQRIPGLGNGVLQDILWTSHLHPKRKVPDLSPEEVDGMFKAVKSVLAKMTAEGGRDTECDLFGRSGGYRTILSKNTVGGPCPSCGAVIRKEPYLGGAIYYCPNCQAL